MSDILYRLSLSKFRSRFHLKKKDIEYIDRIGFEKIKEHASSFINERLKPEIIKNDGKQTPYRGHPVFVAQHATACCCRGCLNKWHKIEENKELSKEETDYILDLIIKWIQVEYEMYKEYKK